VCEAPCTHIDALEPAHDQLPDLHDRGVAPIVEVRANPVQALWRAMSTRRRAWGYDQPETGHVINSTARVRCARGHTFSWPMCLMRSSRFSTSELYLYEAHTHTH
jgi:hypothetical protein